MTIPLAVVGAGLVLVKAVQVRAVLLSPPGGRPPFVKLTALGKR